MPVETEIWVPDPLRPGMLELKRRRTVVEVFQDLDAIVGKYPDGGEEYFSVYPTAEKLVWPVGRIAIFAVTGTNEGHYIHVDVERGERHITVLLAKTFQGKDAAWKFARRLADLLDV